MTSSSLARRLKRRFLRPRVPDSQGTDAARRFIAGDVDGALAAAQVARSARSALVRSEGAAVLAWVYLVRGEREEAERAAAIVRRSRTSDPLLTVALVVAASGPVAGAAKALADTTGILSLVGATRVFVDRGRLADVRAEIATLPAEMERAALLSVQLGLVALGDRTDVDGIADRLAELGQDADGYVGYASVVGELGNPQLAVAYLQLAADRGFADGAMVEADEDLVEARSQPGFAVVQAQLTANARREASPLERSGQGECDA